MYRTGDLVRWTGRDGDARVRRPQRLPGQDPRVPHRTRRDRGRAARATRRRRSRSPIGHARARGRRRAGRRTCCRGRGRHRRADRAPGRTRPTDCPRTWCPPRSCVLDEVPLTPVGQAGPEGAAGAGVRSGATEFRAPAADVERAVAAALRRGARRRAGRRRRRLLRPRRQLADRHPGGDRAPRVASGGGPAAAMFLEPTPAGIAGRDRSRRSAGGPSTTRCAW